MPYISHYTAEQPNRADIDAIAEPTVLEFGTNWCIFCGSAQPLIESAMANHSEVQHIKVEDGRGRLLGRSFNIKLWPTLVFMKDGREILRLVRPENAQVISDALAQICDEPLTVNPMVASAECDAS